MEELLFVNKSLSSAALSRSQADEAVGIRRFVQRRNRRIQNSVQVDSAERSNPPHSKGQSLGNPTSQKRPVRDEILASRRSRHWKLYIPPPRDTRATDWAPSSEPSTESIKSDISHDANVDAQGGIPGPVHNRICWSTVERRGFCYFIDVISSKFTTRECSVFWKGHLPRMVEHSVIIRTLITAFALMHESHDVLGIDNSHAKKCGESALRHCNKAIKGVKGLTGPISRVFLDITCILFVSLEILQGNFASAETCMNSGLSVSGRSRAEVVKYRWDHPIIASEPVLECDAIAVTEAKMAAAFYVFGCRPETPFLQLDQFMGAPDPMEGPFVGCSDLGRRAELLYSITLQAVQSLNSVARIERGSSFAQEMLYRFSSFQHWMNIFRKAASFSATGLDDIRRSRVPEMKVQEAMIVFNCVVLDDDEMAFDSWNSTFENMLDVIDHSLELSTPHPNRLIYHPFSAVFVPPLWLIASRCREPSSRRRAINLLLTYRRRETSHDSYVAGKLAEQIMLIEERGVVTVNGSADVPKVNRIELVAATYVSQVAKVRLVYVHGYEHTGQKSSVTEWIPWKMESDHPSGDEIAALNQFLQIVRKYGRCFSIAERDPA